MAKDFFISYTASDSAWAEWIAWQLEAANYSTVLQAWDFTAGANFVLEMDRATREAKRTIAIVSSAYMESLFTQSEWASAFARDPLGIARSLLPVRVEACRLEGILSQIIYIDLVDLDEGGARRRLLEKIGGTRMKPSLSPGFPGALGASIPRPFPGTHMSGGQTSETILTGRGFVCARLTASGLLDLDALENPYGDALDPSDHAGSGRRLRVFSAIWLPSVEYVQSPMHRLTPVASVCTLDPENVLRRFREVLPSFTETIGEKLPRDMRNDVREKLISAIAYGLQDSLIAAVTIPSIVLGVGRKQAKMGYQTILDLFLFPLLETHCQIGFREFHICLPFLEEASLRANVMKITKRMVAALSASRRGTNGSVDFVSENSFWLTFIHVARFLTWMVGSYYNHRNEKWLLLLKEELESNFER